MVRVLNRLMQQYVLLCSACRDASSLQSGGHFAATPSDDGLQQVPSEQWCPPVTVRRPGPATVLMKQSDGLLKVIEGQRQGCAAGLRSQHGPQHLQHSKTWEDSVQSGRPGARTAETREVLHNCQDTHCRYTLC